MAIMIPEAVEGVGAAAESTAGASATRAPVRSKRAASARRRVVLGSSTGPRPSVPDTRSAPPVGQDERVTRPKRRRGGSAKRAYQGTRKFAASKEGGGVLLAEYLAGVFILVFGSVTRGGKSGYQAIMAELIVRLTALTAVFFVLFLLAGTKAGKAAMWFGVLVDLGIVLTATSQDVFADLANVVQGKPLGNVDDATLTASTSVDEPAPDVTLPDSVPSTSNVQSATLT